MGLLNRIFNFKNASTSKSKDPLKEGMTLERLDHVDEALQKCSTTPPLGSDLARAHFDRGNALLDQGDSAAALSAYELAATLKPDSASTHFNIGNAHLRLGNPAAALVAYRHAATIKPDFAEALTAQGVAFDDLNQPEDAILCYEQALTIAPNSAQTLVNLGCTLSKICRPVDAIAHFQQALQIQPDLAVALSNLLLVKNVLPAQPALEALRVAQQYGALVERLALPYTSWANSTSPDRCIKVGFVSPDLRIHPVGYFLESVLAALNLGSGQRMEIYAYYTHVGVDAVTTNIKQHCTVWRDVPTLSDEQLAQSIRADAIDILIDLSGHTAGNRLPMFAQRPAPVQISWLGYFATTGVASMDYFIADPWTLPLGGESCFTEKVWRLPETRLCFTPPSIDIDVGALPAIDKKFVTFACFNNLVKINDAVVELWAQVLQQVPNSRLFLMAPQLDQATMRNATMQRFAAQGIPSDRLTLSGAVPRADYLEHYQLVDIALDPFPYTGGTTTVEAMWMGVPTLTLSGQSLLSRQGVSLMMNAGLPDWVAQSPEDYVRKAVTHAGDLTALATLRRGLRQRVLASPICDAPRFAAHFEDALRAMWQRWCAQALGQPDENGQDSKRLLTAGMELERQGKIDEALQEYDAAVILEPGLARAHFNRGNILLDRGDTAAALSAYELAVKFKPDSAGAHYNMGNALLRLGALDAGIDALHRAIALKPEFADAHMALGVALMDKHHPEQAIASFDTVLELQPEWADTHHKRGIALQDLHQPENAMRCFERAIAIDPHIADVHSNLGSALIELDRVDEAIASYRRALEINSELVDVHYNLGLALQNSGNRNEAIASYHRALALQPDHASTLNNLGGIFVDIGHNENALTCFRHVIGLQPDRPDAHLNLGIALASMGQTELAMVSFRDALALQPDNVDAMLRLGGALTDAGDFEAALTFVRKGLAIKPDYPLAYNILLFINNFMGDQTAGKAFADAQRFGEMVLRNAQPFETWTNAPDPQRKLRIGLVSGDLCNHPVGYFMEGVLHALRDVASDKLDVFAYLSRACNDPTTLRIQACCSGWHLAAGQSDAALARRIQEDGIDILIDLSGHTAHNRLPMFAWKPAPVQISWLGYFATTGVASIDYLIADEWTLPTDQEQFFTEKIWRLPETRLCFTEPDVDVQVSPLPAKLHGFITFGCFNNLSKMNDVVLALWARVLHAIPGSRLFLKTKQLGEFSARQLTYERFAVHGIDADRLILEESQPRIDFFTAYHRIDIALDPFPYTGGTTTAEALWMGVPVLTLTGEKFLSRQGVGLLMNARLPEWIATNPDDYVAKAVAHAANIPALGILRSELRQRVQASPIFDAPRFARHFEFALRGMWTQWCNNRQH